MGASLFSRFGALDFLGSTKLSGAAIRTPDVTIEPRDLLVLVWLCTGMSGATFPLLRFNGDNGNNYQRSLVQGDTSATTVFANVVNAPTSGIGLGAFNTTAGATGCLIVSNAPGATKVAKLLAFQLGAAVGTQASFHYLGGGGGWFNTTAQIALISMAANDGASNLNVGSGFAVFGMNL